MEVNQGVGGGGGSNLPIGPQPSADSVSVTIATDQTAIPVYISGMASLLNSLKSLKVVTGNGSYRLSVDVNNITAGVITTVGTVTTVGSITALQNQVNMGGVSAFALIQATLRNAFANGVRRNIS